MPLTQHAKLNKWIGEMAAMCKPDDIVLIDGTETQKQELTRQSFKTGELIKLDQEKLPGCVYHRTAINDVARTENLPSPDNPRTSHLAVLSALSALRRLAVEQERFWRRQCTQ